MKPKNNTEVRKAYLRFSGYLTSCIVLAVTILCLFPQNLRHGGETDYGADAGIRPCLCQGTRLGKQRGFRVPIHETDEHLAEDQRRAFAKCGQHTQDEPAEGYPGHGCQGLQALQPAAGKYQHIPRGERFHPPVEHSGGDGKKRPDAVHPGQLEDTAQPECGTQ